MKTPVAIAACIGILAICQSVQAQPIEPAGSWQIKITGLNYDWLARRCDQPLNVASWLPEKSTPALREARGEVTFFKMTDTLYALYYDRDSEEKLTDGLVPTKVVKLTRKSSNDSDIAWYSAEHFVHFDKPVTIAAYTDRKSGEEVFVYWDASKSQSTRDEKYLTRCLPSQ